MVNPSNPFSQFPSSWTGQPAFLMATLCPLLTQVESSTEGVSQMPWRQKSLMQSVSYLQVWPTMQVSGHWPPQSTSVSVPSWIPSVHEGPPGGAQQANDPVHARWFSDWYG